MRYLVTSLVSIILLAGCAAPITNQYAFFDVHSVPSGAWIYNENGQVLGQTPMRVQTTHPTAYNVTANIRLKWASGYSVNQQLTGNKGIIYQNTISRDDHGSDLFKQDLAYALELQKSNSLSQSARAQQQAAEAQATMGAAAWLNMLNNSSKGN
ncbi:hypothetical protein [Thalassotalea montiporae]